MITVHLQGGLGNQLFQWALGQALVNRNQAVCYATEALDCTSTRPYLLDTLLPHRLPLVKCGKGRRRVEQSLRYDPYILTHSYEMVLQGYWQSEKYFADVADKIRDTVFKGMQLNLNTVIMAERIKSQPDSCFLHVRRSDYLLPHCQCYHGLLGTDYIEKAVLHIRGKYPQAHIFVFSDDPEWTTATFAAPYLTIVNHNGWSGRVQPDGQIVKQNGGRECEDLFLMSRCRHAIIANSSFSWWGAWLNDTMERTVIAPQKWFVVPKEVADDTDIVPERWTRL